MIPIRAPLVALAALVLASPASALPDARIDQQIRPNFGGLINPPVKAPYRPAPWRKTPRRGPPRGQPWWAQGGGPAPQRPLLDSISVDCGDRSLGPTPLADAMDALADNGVLHIRSGGAACWESLEIAHPMTLAGDGQPAFSRGGYAAPATLSPPPGAPCIRVAPGVRVEIRDLVIDAQQAGRSACIEASDAGVALIRSRLVYAGDTSAIYVSGGDLVARDASIEARTQAAAVVLDGGSIDFQKVKVVGDGRGLDLTPGQGQSRLVQVGVLSTGAGSTGIVVRDLRGGGGRVQIANAVVRGWSTGIYVDRGARADIWRTRIHQALRGVTADAGQVSLRESLIEAQDYGGYFSGGYPTVEFNRVVGATNGMTITGSGAKVQPNYVYSAATCPPSVSWTAVSYCLPMLGAPVAGEGDDTQGAGGGYGWDQDGYDRGYTRDGQPEAFLSTPTYTSRAPTRSRRYR